MISKFGFFFAESIQSGRSGADEAEATGERVATTGDGRVATEGGERDGVAGDRQPEETNQNQSQLQLSLEFLVRRQLTQQIAKWPSLFHEHTVETST